MDDPAAPLMSPPSRSDRLQRFIGETARPLGIFVVSCCAGWATVVIAYKVTTFGEAALFIAAVFAGVGALYGVKSWENSQAGKHTATVEVAKANAPPVQ